MVKKVTLATVVLFTAVSLYANNECVCFELKGEFGDEIRAILQKYSKNLGSKDIKVVREDADLSTAERSFLESLVGSAKVSGDNVNTKAYDIENGKKLYERDCASCHGINAEIPLSGNAAIATWKADDIVIEIRDYQLGQYEGPSRFVKQTTANTYRSKDMNDIAQYIQTLGGGK